MLTKIILFFSFLHRFSILIRTRTIKCKTFNLFMIYFFIIIKKYNINRGIDKLYYFLAILLTSLYVFLRFSHQSSQPFAS